MSSVDRRTFLAAVAFGGAAAVLAACSRPATPTVVQTSPPTVAPPPAAPDWESLRSRISGSLYLEGADGYEDAKRVENPRFDGALPLAVLAAATADDVAQAVRFAGEADVPFVVRAGGHSYSGYSSGDVEQAGLAPSLVIDLRGLSGITVEDSGAAVVGAGASLIQVYGAVGARGRAVAGGSCATVGVAGLTLGGGVGVLTRAYGLTSDALRAVELVAADGEILTASPDENEDLLWACRGGGGQVGIVTSLTFETVPAPTITTVFLEWAFTDAVPVILAWQQWAPEADPRLWSTLKLLSGARHDGPTIQLTVTWTGPSAELDAQVAGLHEAAGVLPLVNSVRPDRTYTEVMFTYAGCAGVPVDQCTTGDGGALRREAFSATSHVPYDLLDADGAAVLVERCVLGHRLGAIETGVSLDALGGAVRELPADSTAFGHRGAYATVQYTATYEEGGDPVPFDEFVRQSRASMVPFWGEGAYFNYSDSTLTDPGTSYFGENAKRLAEIRAAADPAGVFATPAFRTA
ncbi:FAD-binding oxidoreductase [Arthrobacter crusticola]|uniref:FAD-binding oxidoreductase n=1 Tax=Arthrobacter crusticola TaxID=2547960 RepID=A0A4R5TVS2_9MICC|nr:FAD-binding oxidoreductase [Arthrobacter crusticola]TDK25214.1 FAD-binding oxidoreductase [Arthrobacter crusticola]